MPHSIRLPRETDDQFRQRALRCAQIARLLVDAALANHCIQELIADPELPYTTNSVARCPTVRVDYEQALAIGEIGTCLRCTRSKYWGDGPQILPLEADDPVDPFRVLYVYKPGSLYNRRFEQRRRLKEMLGKRYRPLVKLAQDHTRTIFLDVLTSQQAYAIRAILGLEPALFWRLARGRCFVQLPDAAPRLDDRILRSLRKKPRQLPLPFERPKTREDFRQTQ